MDVDSKSEMYIARPLFKPSMQSIWKDTIIVVYHVTNEENRTLVGPVLIGSILSTA